MDQTQTPSEHPKLDALVAGYLEAVERGEAPDRGQIIAENPDLATELRMFFADLDRVQRAAASPNDGPAPNKPDAAHASTVIRPNNEPTPGVIIAGRYKLLESIGEGGMGSVWVAEQLKPVKRKVAIKLIKPGMDSKQVLARFEAERQALAVMDHPNIAKVFDGGLTEQGRPYFVMEYVKGVPFTDYCDRARLPLKDRLTLFIAVCSAVQHAHQKGIVHRDLKPSNILICLYDGHPVPKVIDFGLAKAMHQPLTEQSIFTGHGVMVGTPLYMSPEQAESNNLDIDTRTDIYSLGVVLYELLTGSTPLERQQLQKAAFDEVLRLIKEVEPPRPSLRLSGSDSLASIAAQRSIDPKQLSRSLAGDLDWIVMKTLDKERSRRYETANGLARDIERFLNEEPVEACPPSTAYRLKKYIHRHRGQVIAAGVVLTTLLLGIIGTTWGLFQAEAANEMTKLALREVITERDAKEAERVKAATAREQAQETAKQLSLQKNELEASNSKSSSLLLEAAQSDCATARNLWGLGRHRDALAHWARSFDYAPQSYSDINTIIENIQQECLPQPLFTLPGNLVQFSPDGSRIVTACDDVVKVWESSTGSHVCNLAGHADGVASMAFSPDGKQLVTGSYDDTARIWNLETGQTVVTLIGHEHNVDGASFSFDGTRVVTMAPGESVRVWDSATGRQLVTIPGSRLTKNVDNKLGYLGTAAIDAGSYSTSETGIIRQATFSPTGRQILITYLDGNVAELWDASSGVLVSAISGHTRSIGHATFSHDGSHIVTHSTDGTAKVWDASTATVVATLSGHQSILSDSAFSPDGTRIVTGSYDNTARVWEVASGKLICILDHHDALVDTTIFSSDGQRVVTYSHSDQTSRVWDATTGIRLADLAGHLDSSANLVFSPDGNRIASRSEDDTVRVWDAAIRLPIDKFVGHEDYLNNAAFSADGRLVVTASDDKTARVWDAATGQSLTTLTGHENVVTDAAFSPDSKQVVTASSDKSAKLWSTESGKCMFTLAGHEDSLKHAVFSPDGKRIVTVSEDTTARIWDSATGQSLAVLVGHKHGVKNVKISPDGTKIVTVSYDEDTARVWSADSGNPLVALCVPKEEGVGTPEFSPDSKRIVTGSRYGSTRVWDATTGQTLLTLTDPDEESVGSAVFSPDGRTIITMSEFDDIVRVWDSSTGKHLHRYRRSFQDERDVSFSSDRKRIVRVSYSYEAYLLDVLSERSPPPSWFKTLLRLLGSRSHNSEGELTDWPPLGEEAQVIAKLKQEVNSDETRFGDFGRYFLTPGLDKPTYPGSKVTCGEAADRLIRPVALQPEIKRAYNWHPAHPLVHIALAKFESDPKRAEFLREYGVSRLLKRQPSSEDSAPELATLCHRAEALLLEQKDQTRADLVHKRAEELASKP